MGLKPKAIAHENESEMKTAITLSFLACFSRFLDRQKALIVLYESIKSSSPFRNFEKWARNRNRRLQPTKNESEMNTAITPSFLAGFSRFLDRQKALIVLYESVKSSSPFRNFEKWALNRRLPPTKNESEMTTVITPSFLAGFSRFLDC